MVSGFSILVMLTRIPETVANCHSQEGALLTLLFRSATEA
jgi:hypothetical protein